jgi:putative addiction module component (TIGR02574 family)
MDVGATLAEIRSLTIDERLRIAEAIWDSIADDSEDLEISPAERELIEERLAAYLARPDEVVPWEKVKAEALARIQR